MMLKRIGLLAIAFVALVLKTASAVPRYAASSPQVGDSPVTQQVAESADAVTVPQVGGNMPHAKIITQGGDDVIKNSSGDVIGVVRPSGESHWVGNGKNEVVPEIGSRDGNEIGKDSTVWQPQTAMDGEQLQEGQQPFTREQEDAKWVDKRGCVYDGKTAKKVGYQLGSKCEEEWNRKNEETCKAHEPMDKEVVNKIAYDNLQYFNSDVTAEMQMYVMRDGRYTSAAWGNENTVGGANDIKVVITEDTKAIMSIHSHPYNKIHYGGWPSFMDVVAHLVRGMGLKKYLKSIGCSHDGENYSYIVHFSKDGGRFDTGMLDDGTIVMQKVYDKVEAPILLRFDENGVYSVSKDGTESQIDMPDAWKGKSFVSTTGENKKRLENNSDFRENHRPYNFGDSKDVADAIKRAEARIKKQNSIPESGRVLLFPEVASSTDVKKALEEFHIKFLSLPNNQFKWQQIQAYLDLVVSLESWTLPPEKVSNKLVREGSMIRTRNNTWKDLVEVPLANDDSRSCWVKEKVGICGWCRCQPPHVTKRDSEWILVGTQMARASDGQREQTDAVGLLSFRVCKKCGKCYTYRSLGEGYNDLMHNDTDFHVLPFSETVDEHVSQTHKRIAALMRMEDAIMSIPDGEIVVPISKECSCRRRSGEKPNVVAFYERQKNEKGLRRYVCVNCFGLYGSNNMCTAK